MLDAPPRPTPFPTHSEAVHSEAVHSEVATAAVVAATVGQCDSAEPTRRDVDDEQNHGSSYLIRDGSVDDEQNHGSVSTAKALDGAVLGSVSSVVGGAVLGSMSSAVEGTSGRLAVGVAEPLMRVGAAAYERSQTFSPANEVSSPANEHRPASSPSKLAIHRSRRYTWDEDDEGPGPSTRRAEPSSRRTEQEARRAEQASELDERSFGSYPNTWERDCPNLDGSYPNTWERDSADEEHAAGPQPERSMELRETLTSKHLVFPQPERCMELRETLFFCGPQSRPQSRGHHDTSESDLELPLASPSHPSPSPYTAPNTASWHPSQSPLYPAIPSPSYRLPYPSYPSAPSPSAPSPSLSTPSSRFCFACGTKLVRTSVAGGILKTVAPQFCSSCGQPQVQPQAQAQAQVQPQVQASGSGHSSHTHSYAIKPSYDEAAERYPSASGDVAPNTAPSPSRFGRLPADELRALLRAHALLSDAAYGELIATLRAAADDDDDDDDDDEREVELEVELRT